MKAADFNIIFDLSSYFFAKRELQIDIFIIQIVSYSVWGWRKVSPLSYEMLEQILRNTSYKTTLRI